MTDVRGLSIQWENKINGLYALFVSLQRVNMRYMAKMKNRNNNPQTANQLRTQLQICNRMKKALKKVKNHENLLTESHKKLLPRSCDIDPLKADDKMELINPYFKKPPTKPAPVPNLFSKKRNTDKCAKAPSLPVKTCTMVTSRQTEDST